MESLENWVITRTERCGPDEYSPPCCPCCGHECERYYKDRFGEIFACDECVSMADAADEWEDLRWQL